MLNRTDSYDVGGSNTQGSCALCCKNGNVTSVDRGTFGGIILSAYLVNRQSSYVALNSPQPLTQPFEVLMTGVLLQESVSMFTGRKHETRLSPCCWSRLCAGTNGHNNNNNNIFILYSAKSIYSSKRFTIKMYNIVSVKLIRNVKYIINIQVKKYATCS